MRRTNCPAAELMKKRGAAEPVKVLRRASLKPPKQEKDTVSHWAGLIALGDDS